MPFTPFHMGAGLLGKGAIPRSFSLTVFGMTQVVLDLEVLWHMLRHEYPWHTFWHTCLGATLLAAGMAVFGKPASQRLKAAWNRTVPDGSRFRVVVPTSWTASLTGAFFGAYSHVLLDCLYHADIRPWQPWSEANRLLGVINPGYMELLCVGMGLAGVLGLLARVWRMR
jgi:hypothetical protein